MTDLGVQRVLSSIEKLHDIGIALSSETDTDRLIETILLGAKELTGADAGTLYRVEGDYLLFGTLRNDSLGIALGGTTGRCVDFDPIPLKNGDGSPNHTNIAAYAAVRGVPVNIADAYAATADFDFSGTRRVDRQTGYRSRSLLTLPLKSHEGDVVAVLQLINAKDPLSGAVVAFSEADQRLAESLASQAAIALNKQALIDGQRKLFESFIQLIAKAIDAKNPHTGAHCERVPELTLMLAEAVGAVADGPFSTVRFTPEELYEIKIAAWLHDCGKVTTPEHIINKATKLETIVDRIDWVETRCEVVRRDLLIAQLRGEIDRADYERLIAELDSDRRFLCRVNTGGESMTDTDVQRVGAIAAKYCYTDADGRRVALLSEQEVYNLQIRRGTLTTEERQVMNRHMDVTIEMLESLPYPKHLRRVPEIAGGHHERMDGTGFPRGLTREQMSVPARIMGIADIFEALTAAERPYKQPMTLSQALAVLGRLKLERHIDPDLFDVFVREKVYLRYAEQHLRPEQIDAVDLARIPGFEHGQGQGRGDC